MIDKHSIGAMVHSVFQDMYLDEETQHDIDRLVEAFYKEREMAEWEYNTYLVRSTSALHKSLHELKVVSIERAAQAAERGGEG